LLPFAEVAEEESLNQFSKKMFENTEHIKSMQIQIGTANILLVAPFAGSYVEVPIAINKLIEWLFSRVLVSHAGGPGLIPGRDISVSGLLD